MSKRKKAGPVRKPWMPFYWKDYSADTMHLTTLQHGAYLLLILHYWRTESPPPGDDDERMAAIAKLSVSEWRSMKSIIAAFFIDGWHHKRVETELGILYKRQGQARAAARKGGIESGITRSGRRAVELDCRPLVTETERRRNRSGRFPKGDPSAIDWSEARASPELEKLVRGNEASASKHNKINGVACEAVASTKAEPPASKQVEAGATHNHTKKEESTEQEGREPVENFLPLNHFGQSSGPKRRVPFTFSAGELATARDERALARQSEREEEGHPVGVEIPLPNPLPSPAKRRFDEAAEQLLSLFRSTDKDTLQ